MNRFVFHPCDYCISHVSEYENNYKNEKRYKNLINLLNHKWKKVMELFEHGGIAIYSGAFGVKTISERIFKVIAKLFNL